MSVAAPTPEVSNSSGGDVDMASLGTALWRKKRRILLSTIIVALLTLIVVQTITPRYQSESRVLIESRDNVYLRPDADKITTDLTVDAEAVTSQAQIILSRDLAREVINKLKLGDRPEFDFNAERCFSAQGAPGPHRHRQGSAEHESRGAGASGLLRPP